MVSILLTILKILGIVLSVILGMIVVLLLLVLFVPVRYRISGSRKAEDEGPLSFHIKVTWLLHLIQAVFSYPDAPYLKVRIACITVFGPDKPFGKKKREEEDMPARKEGQKKGKSGKKPEQQPAEEERDSRKPGLPQTETEPEGGKTDSRIPEAKAESVSRMPENVQENQDDGEGKDAVKEGFFKKFIEFIRKLKAAFKNIRYTIGKICDKIKHIVNNIRYYTEVIKSETFNRAFKVCSGQVFALLKAILPGKVEGSLHIGTGDPAGTGQVLAVYGMLYPFIGNHIDIQPDFEQQILEGELFLKGKITVFKALKTAWIIYFNKDLRRLIKLFKREAA